MDYDMAPQSASLPTYFRSSPFYILSKGLISSSSNSWLVTKKTKTLWGDFQLLYTSVRGDFSSLHPELSQIPASAVWSISNMFLNCSPCGGAKFFHCYGLDLLNTIWTQSSGNLLTFVVGSQSKWLVRECLDRVYVYDYVKEASQTISASVCLLPGAVNLIARGFYTAEHDIAACRLHLRSWLPLCICHAGVPVQSTCARTSMCLWRARACVHELWGLAPYCSLSGGGESRFVCEHYACSD
jgi:hypothetical protein